MEIIQKPVPNHGSRLWEKPCVIVNHISAGTIGSMTNTFKNPRSQKSSHFAISRAGEIVQYVTIDRAAWTQGRIQKPTTPIIQQKGGNPNRYGVSIEHEGYEKVDKQTNEVVEYGGLHGDLTEEQYWSSVWLHKWIQTEVQRIYGVTISLNSSNVIGHYQIDAPGKPFCPGPLFPWQRLYIDLAAIDTMTLAQAEEHIAFQRSNRNHTMNVFAVTNRVRGLMDNIKLEIHKEESERKLNAIGGVLVSLGMLEGDVFDKAVFDRIEALYAAFEGKYKEEATRKFNLIHAEMKRAALL